MVLQSPIATDTVAVNYRGQLINGTVFDQSYQGELDPETATPRNISGRCGDSRVEYGLDERIWWYESR